MKRNGSQEDKASRQISEVETRSNKNESGLKCFVLSGSISPLKNSPDVIS